MHIVKIGIRPDSFRRWGDKRYQKMKEYGYSCAEYVLVNSKAPIYQYSDEKFEKMILQEKTLANEAGIEITQVHGPCFPHTNRELESEEQAERFLKLERSIRATVLLECSNWVVHPLMPYGIADLETGDEKKTWAINMEFMKKLLVPAREYNVTICLENMPYTGFSLGAPEAVYRFVAEMDDEHFKMCLDTGHANVFPEGNPAEVLRKYAEVIRVLHVHDNDGKMDQHLIPYFGNINWKEFYQVLQEVQFQGDFSLETEPSRWLPNPLYEEMCAVMMKIVRYIMDETQEMTVSDSMTAMQC